MIKVAVLDDYQNVFQQIVDVKKYKNKFDFKYKDDTIVKDTTDREKTNFLFAIDIANTIKGKTKLNKEGGNFEIKNPAGQELKMPLGQLRKRGTVIIFPSFLQHRVTEVKRGVRHSLVQWYNGPEFK